MYSRLELVEGDTVAVSGAAGGIGSIAVQLAKRSGATVIGIASPRHHEWLESHDVVAVAYGEGLAERLRDAANGQLDAFIDTFGPPRYVPRNGGVTDYVELALELGVPNDRIYTTINFPAIQKHSVKGQPNAPESSPEALAELVRLIGEGELEIPIAGVFALEDVQDAYKALAAGHTRGKIVLKP